LSGVLYVYSFTAIPATALLLLLSKSQGVLLAGVIASLGAACGDLVVFQMFRYPKPLSFTEAEQQQRYDVMLGRIREVLPGFSYEVTVILLVMFFLILPLPNEFGDFLLAKSKAISTKWFLVISYVLNGIGILVIQSVGKHL